MNAILTDFRGTPVSVQITQVTKAVNLLCTNRQNEFSMYKTIDKLKCRNVNVFLVKPKYMQSSFLSKTRLITIFKLYVYYLR